MHRRRRHVRRTLTGLGLLATIAALAAMVASGIFDSTSSSPAASDVRTNTYSGPGVAGQDNRPSLADRVWAGAQAQAEARAKEEAEAKAKAEAEAKQKAKEEAEAKQKAEAEAKAQAEAEAERKAAADAAARSAERAAADPRSVANGLMAEQGWAEAEFSCLEQLWTRESNWDHTAENPSSGAYGIPQSLPPEKMAEFGDDYRTNPVTQIEWGLSYIDQRYGTPCSAWSFWQANNWY